MHSVTKIKTAKCHILTVSLVLLTLKLFKAVNFNWIVALFPILLLVFFEILFFVWGYIIYRKNSGKYD